MQLKLQRSQRTGGLLGDTAFFCIDARAELNPAELASVQRYRLGSQLLYSSEGAKRSAEGSALSAAQARARGISAHSVDDAIESVAGTLGHGLKSLALGAIAAMKLHITIDSLQRGQHIECKSLDEVIGAENALKEACQNLVDYLYTASTFDGHEDLWEFLPGKAEVIATSTTPDPMLVSPGNGHGSGPTRSGKPRPLLLGDESAPMPEFEGNLDPNRMDRSAGLSANGLPPAMPPIDDNPDDGGPPMVLPIRSTKKRPTF